MKESIFPLFNNEYTNEECITEVPGSGCSSFRRSAFDPGYGIEGCPPPDAVDDNEGICCTVFPNR